MGGWGSGRTREHHLVDDALTLNLPLMLRRGLVKKGRSGRQMLRFRFGGERCASIRLAYDLTDPYESWLRLNYTRTFHDGGRTRVEQLIRLTYTEPNFGGRRWWMVCPSDGRRVAKLYLPPGGDTFASREEWRLVYRSQREEKMGRTLERLSRLKDRL